MPYQAPSRDVQSPSKPGSGSAQNFIVRFDVESSRLLLRDDLKHRVEFQDRAILPSFLAFQNVKDSTVTRCHRDIEMSRKAELSMLKQAIKDADEDAMYSPLVVLTLAAQRFTDPNTFIQAALFDEIEHSRTYDTASFYRRIVSTSSAVLQNEGQELPPLKPDFVVVELEPTVSDNNRVLRRQVSAYVEVKSKEIDRPEPQFHTTVKKVTGQAADYSNLIFSSRPFHIFAIGMLIFGSKFCVSISDRAGIRFSEEYDIFENLDIFIRIVRRLTCELSPVDLGHDPTVELLSGQTYYQKQYPRFKVGMGGARGRSWVTYGPPLFVSISFLGRGTSVWYVTGPHGRSILKVAWRDALRKSESDIYSLVGAGHPGVARFLDGGDVLYPSQAGRAIKIGISHIRNRQVMDQDNRVLHRVLMEPVGRMLWDFDNDNQFILGFRAALEGEFWLNCQITNCNAYAHLGHRYLHRIGILHRDISAGNIYLWDHRDNQNPLSPSAGQEGFIADLELASCTPASTVSVLRERPPPRLGSGATPIPIPSNNPCRTSPLRGVFHDAPSPPKSRGPQMTVQSVPQSRCS